VLGTTWLRFEVVRGARYLESRGQLVQHLAANARGQLGAYDLHYMDQSWTALFPGDTIDPRENYDRKRDLALPDFDWNDFSKPLMQGISTYKDKLIDISELLIQRETLEGDEFEQLFEGIPRPEQRQVEPSRLRPPGRPEETARVPNAASGLQGAPGVASMSEPPSDSNPWQS